MSGSPRGGASNGVHDPELVTSRADVEKRETVVAADQIVVLDGGRVAEVGTHTELLDLGGRYADFWESRRRAQGWRLAP